MLCHGYIKEDCLQLTSTMAPTANIYYWVLQPCKSNSPIALAYYAWNYIQNIQNGVTMASQFLTVHIWYHVQLKFSQSFHPANLQHNNTKSHLWHHIKPRPLNNSFRPTVCFCEWALTQWQEWVVNHCNVPSEVTCSGLFPKCAWSPVPLSVSLQGQTHADTVP